MAKTKKTGLERGWNPGADFTGFVLNAYGWLALEIMNDPKKAVLLLVLEIAYGLFFPSQYNDLNFLLIILLGACLLLVTVYLLLGKKRTEVETSAMKKVPYIGSLLLLPNRNRVEDAAISGYMYAIVIALIFVSSAFFALHVFGLLGIAYRLLN